MCKIKDKIHHLETQLTNQMLPVPLFSYTVALQNIF